MSIKKMPILIFLVKKFASTSIFLTKKLALKFLIVKSWNCQDSYTTYLKLSVIRDNSPKKLHLFIIKSYINPDNWRF